MDAYLRAEFLRRKEKDQAARLGGDAEAIGAVDAENLPWLKQVAARRDEISRCQHLYPRQPFRGILPAGAGVSMPHWAGR